jgi:hypothetical protein
MDVWSKKCIELANYAQNSIFVKILIKMKSALLLLLCLLGTLCIAQKKSEGRLTRFDMVLQGNIESNEGTIILNDGKELIGLVAYNDKTGILKYESGNDSRSLTARNVMAFEVYDPDFDGNRMFYVFPKEDQKTGTIRPFFFELIKDFKTFAVLIRKEPVDLKEKKDLNPLSTKNLFPGSTSDYENRGKVVIQQIETFYLLKPGEDPMAYFSIIVENNLRKPLLFNDKKVKEKYIEKDLLKEFMGSLFENVETYAKDNNLSFKDKPDFLKILEFYETLID